jgi:hypothetical protein
MRTKYSRPLGHHQKTTPTNYGYRRRDKGIENIFNKIVAENFPNLEKKIFQIEEAFRTQDRHDQKRNITRCIIINVLNI